MGEQRDTRVARVASEARMAPDRVVKVEFDVNQTNTNVWAMTEEEARELGRQLLDVAGVTDEMCEAFREGWHSESAKGRRVRAGLRRMVRA